MKANNFESNLDNYFISSEQIEIDDKNIEIKLNCIYCCFPCTFDIILIVLLIGAFFLFLYTELIVLLIPTILLLIFFVIFCLKNPIMTKIKLMKNQNTGELILRTLGLINCCKCNDITLYPEEFYFKVLNHNNQDMDSGEGITCYFNFYLLILKNFKNNKEIDLDLSNIKKTPVNTFYYFRIKNDYDSRELQNRLNKFTNTFEYSNGFQFQKRFSDYFYTYYFFNPMMQQKNFLYYLLLFYHVAMYYVFQFTVFFFKKRKYNTSESLLIFFIIYLTSLILFFICYSFHGERRLRIDCIYSNNFDRIFIGIVKYNGKSYLKTFMFDVNSINKFVFQEQNKEYVLKVIFNEGETFQEIAKFNQKKEDLLEIISFLNYKVINQISNNTFNPLSETPTNDEK